MAHRFQAKRRPSMPFRAVHATWAHKNNGLRQSSSVIHSAMGVFGPVRIELNSPRSKCHDDAGPTRSKKCSLAVSMNGEREGERVLKLVEWPNLTDIDIMPTTKCLTKQWFYLSLCPMCDVIITTSMYTIRLQYYAYVVCLELLCIPIHNVRGTHGAKKRQARTAP